MIKKHPIYRYLAHHPGLPGLVYLAVVAVLCFITVFSLVDIVERYGVRDASFETLTRLQERAHISSAEPHGVAQSWPPGSPFLEGQTITLASAALLQRMTSAITAAGGSVISTEVEPQRQPNDRSLRAIASFELEQPALQHLLYDIEAGMPFLYVDQLSVAPKNEEGRMRVLLTASGLWRGEE